MVPPAAQLKEETGYIGSVATCSGTLAMSPGLCDETIKLCVVEVDADAPENRRPQQQLEETEFIVVRRVPVGGLLSAIGQMESEGMVPFAGLYALATGLSLGLLGGGNSGNLPGAES